ncbi:ubiquitin-protein ligase E3, partial [Schizosaccharomyces japonicus yFS275]
ASSPTKPQEEHLRCWICYEDYTGRNPSRDGWRRPCKCSLAAHESCLLSYMTLSQIAMSPQCPYEIQIVSAPLDQRSILVRSIGLYQSLEIGFVQTGFCISTCFGITRFIHSTLSQTGLWVCRQVVEPKTIDTMLRIPAFHRFVLPLIPFMLIRNTNVPIHDLTLSLCVHLSVYTCAGRVSRPTLLLCLLPWVRTLYAEVMRRLFAREISSYTRELQMEDVAWFRQFENQLTEHREQMENADNERNQVDTGVLVSLVRVLLDAFTGKFISVIRPIFVLPLAGRIFGRLVPGRFSRLEKSIIGACASVVAKDLAVYLFYVLRRNWPWRARVLNDPSHCDFK